MDKALIRNTFLPPNYFKLAVLAAQAIANRVLRHDRTVPFVQNRNSSRNPHK